MSIPKKEYELFVISIANPILIGLYQNGKLVKTLEQEGKTSDVLPLLIHGLLKEIVLSKLYYVNGPGSYMAIKIAYIFLKTLSITLDIELKAYSGFELNNNSPIKALGKTYFHNDKVNSLITLKPLDKNTILEDFKLADYLGNLSIQKDTLPNYQLPAVY
jgi:tRNA A37 threonylcarbamoyladenosine modification protein TsaB